MGGLGPGIGGLEYVVIGLVALLVLGPERLPVMLRKLGQLVARARNMANEFRASFDEMARQAELDELRKEVEALKRGQGLTAPGAVPLGAEAEDAFRDIGQSLGQTVPASTTPYTPPALPEPTVDEWPDTPPPEPAAAPKVKRKAPARKTVAKATAKPAAKTEDKAQKSPAARKPSPARKAAAPRRTKKADQ